jgi:DNA-binding transcriptional regulator YiaG
LPCCHLRRIVPKPLPAAYPKRLTTIGDHIRKRRLDLSLFQAQVAQQLGVDETTVHHWETHATQPMIRCLPKIIAFLGHDPFPPAHTLGEQITRYRRANGLSRLQLAKRFGVDPGTLWRWESGQHLPGRIHLSRVNARLSGGERAPDAKALRPA